MCVKSTGRPRSSRACSRAAARVSPRLTACTDGAANEAGGVRHGRNVRRRKSATARRRDAPGEPSRARPGARRPAAPGYRRRGSCHLAASACSTEADRLARGRSAAIAKAGGVVRADQRRADRGRGPIDADRGRPSAADSASAAVQAYHEAGSGQEAGNVREAHARQDLGAVHAGDQQTARSASCSLPASSFRAQPASRRRRNTTRQSSSGQSLSSRLADGMTTA